MPDLYRAPAEGTLPLSRTRDGVVTVSHGPVPELKWPAMTMEFEAPGNVASGVKAGDAIAFDFTAHDGAYRITRIAREAGGAS